MKLSDLICERKSEMEVLKNNKKPLTPEERDEVMKKDAVWNLGPHGKPTPAVWKSVNPKTNKTTYVTNTHRVYQTASTLAGAISKYHSVVKDTA